MKRKKVKKWLRLIVFFPLIFFMIYTNIHVDPASIYHDDTEEMAIEMLEGKNAYFYGSDGDMRGVKQHYIEYMPKQVDCVIVGPSLSMGINNENVGSDSYCNLSFSEANFYDIMAIFAFLDINEVKTKRVILCVDLYFFDEEHNEQLIKPEWKPYSEYMMAKLDGNSKIVDPRHKRGFSHYNLEKLNTEIQQSVSITYFQASLKEVKKNQSFFHPTPSGKDDIFTEDHAHFMPDGSWVYGADVRNQTIDDVIYTAEHYDIEYEFNYGKHVSQDKFDYFDKLINYLLMQDVDVELYMCPLPPVLWDRLYTENEDSQYFIVKEVEEHARQVADENKLKITGSFDPYVVGVKDSDYYDCRHIRYEYLDDYFDFSE